MSGSEQDKIRCRFCKRQYPVKPQLAGKKVRCKCRRIIKMPNATPVVSANVAENADTYDLEDVTATTEPVADSRPPLP